MPAKPSWLLRVPEILAELEPLAVPFLDRPTVERLFRVRRRANQLMARFGGFQIGRTFLVDRQQLAGWLRAVASGREFELEERRRSRVLESLEAARKIQAARRVRIAAAAEVRDLEMARLPGGIHLQPGELRIEFAGAEDLLRRLLELSQAIMNDYARFQELVEPGHRNDPGLNQSGSA